ncbi:MAG: tetratricopeptide repeat protein [Rhizobiaceae bacterium]|nr:tetratricopeptide repeat protein [Rhizobiaceae bacterium]MCV0406194.1 tetratricopeptide repeat protein [Rhizobiaceae bacterium]
MRLTWKKRLATGAAAVALSLAASSAGWAKTETQDAPSVKIGSFSGAVLAARIAESDNDLASAIAYYRRALTFNDDDQAIQQGLMLALIANGEFEAALPLADRLKEVPEVERFSRLALGIDAIRKGDYSQAGIYMQIALASDLDRLIGGLVSAWAKFGGGDVEGALAEVGQLNGPEWYDLFRSYHRALLLERAGRKDEAIQAYDATLTNVTAGAASPDVYLRAAEAYAGYLVRENDRAGAEAVLDKAAEFATGRLPLDKLREDLKAGKTVRQLVPDAKAGAAEVLLNLASALNRSGGESFTRLYLQYARVLAPTNDSILVQLGQVAEQQEKPEEAIAFYRQVPLTSSMKRAAEMQLGLNLADLDRHDEAIGHLKALVEQDPDDMRAYLALGGVYASKEDFRSAADLYDRAVSRISGEPQREHWNIFYQRGIAYERLKEWPKAEPNFRQALELFPDQPQVLNYLGYSWVDMNMNLEEGLEMIQKAVELRPNDGYIVDSLGWAYYRLQRFDEAVEALERAVSIRPQDPILNDHLGDAYWRVGRRLEATFQWTHARDLDPDEDVLAEVEKKLAEGLPALEEKKAELPPVTESPGTQVAAAGVAGIVAPSVPEANDSDATGEPVHVVAPGDSLWSISAERLGDGARYPELLDLNPSLRGNPGSIRPGQELILPR